VTAPFQEWVEEEVMEAKVTAPFQEEEARVALVGEPLLAAVLPALASVASVALVLRSLAAMASEELAALASVE